MKPVYLLPVLIPLLFIGLKLSVDNTLNKAEYNTYVRSVRTGNWGRGTYERAVEIFERELANPDNDVRFVINELCITNRSGTTKLFSYQIKLGDVSMLLPMKDYFAYKKYVLKRSKSYPIGAGLEVDPTW